MVVAADKAWAAEGRGRRPGETGRWPSRIEVRQPPAEGMGLRDSCGKLGFLPASKSGGNRVHVGAHA